MCHYGTLIFFQEGISAQMLYMLRKALFEKWPIIRQYEVKSARY